MGMYTEFHFNTELVKDTPRQVLDTLAYMTGQSQLEPSSAPDHPLFTTGRWNSMLGSSSYYFALSPASSVDWDDIAKCHYLHVRCNFKNYGGEIEHFLDWIMPWVEAGTECLGYYRYEENDHPTLIYRNLSPRRM